MVAFSLRLDEQKSSLSLSFQKMVSFFHAIFLAAFLWITFHFLEIASHLSNKMILLLWYGSGCLCIISGFFIFLNPFVFLEKVKTHPLESFYGAVAASALGIYTLVDFFVWPFFSGSTTFAVYFILKSLGFAMIFDPNPTVLRHSLFEAQVAATCSGLEGIAIFVFIFSLILMSEWEKFLPKRIFFIYLAGFFYMVMLNVFRVAVFFAAAIWVTHQWGRERASELFVWFFHEHIGWVLYFIGIPIFIALILRTNFFKKRPA
jgi:exosortase/archaeosortase family protein